MENNAVRVLLLSTWPRDPLLEFVLIFPDHYEKHFSFDEYAIRAYRGASERAIIEDCVRTYFADNGEHVEIVQLIFL
jgi:hypothetical protein